MLLRLIAVLWLWYVFVLGSCGSLLPSVYGVNVGGFLTPQQLGVGVCFSFVMVLSCGGGGSFVVVVSDWCADVDVCGPLIHQHLGIDVCFSFVVVLSRVDGGSFVVSVSGWCSGVETGVSLTHQPSGVGVCL